MSGEVHPYVSRGGLKLAAGLEAFGLDVTGWVCADLGCNVGGFTDCLLQRGAAKVYAVDTGYGALAWKLRQDDRVVVMERTNAMHVDPPAAVDLVVMDLAWTRQEHAIPAALRWKPREIVTLIKPHYEAGGVGSPTPRHGEFRATGPSPRGRGDENKGRGTGLLSDEEAERVTQEVLGRMEQWGVRVKGFIRSPIRGGAGKGKAGNVEYLAWVG